MNMLKKDRTVDKISVVMLLPSFPPFQVGGSEMQALKMGEKLVKKSIDVIVVTPWKKGAKKREILNGIRVERVYSILNYIWRSASLFKKILLKIYRSIKHSRKSMSITDYIKQNKSLHGVFGWRDLLFSMILFVNVFFFLYKEKRKFDILYIPTVSFMAIVGTLLSKALNKKAIVKDSTMDGLIKMKFMPFGKFFQRLVVRHCYFVAMTKSIEENLKKVGVPANRIFRIPNGVNIPENINRKDINTYECLFVGNLYQQPAKGLDILLAAWKLVISEFPAAKLYIIGGGNLKEYLNYAEELSLNDTVFFLGRVNNVSHFFGRSNVFVLPSRREGLSNALLEAMAYAMPVVATDISGNQDLIKNGINGMLATVDDPTALYQAIIFMFKNQDKARQMGFEARATVIKNCDINIVADEYISVFNNLLKAKVVECQ